MAKVSSEYRWVEMSNDRKFSGRVTRLSLISAVALGAIWGSATYTLDAHPMIEYSLLAGWIMMPTILSISLVWPSTRMLVLVPSTLVTVGLLAVCVTALPALGPARYGWISLTAGILLGDALGAWFWYRWLPVPTRLSDPFSLHRWVMIGLHVLLVTTGLLLVLVGGK